MLFLPVSILVRPFLLLNDNEASLLEDDEELVEVEVEVVAADEEEVGFDFISPSAQALLLLVVLSSLPLFRFLLPRLPFLVASSSFIVVSFIVVDDSLSFSPENCCC